MNIETVNELKSNAWIHAQAELAGIESRVRNTAKANASEADLRELYEAETVPYVIAHMMRSEAACALALRHGLIPLPALEMLGMSLRSFCQAAVAARRAFCKAKPCEWKGEVGEAGPVGTCPLCGTTPVSILDLIAPPSSNGNHGGRLRLVDP